MMMGFRRAGNGVVWGSSIGSLLVFMILERRIFTRYLGELELQLLVVCILFSAALPCILGGRLLPTKVLALAIFTAAIALAIAWFIVFFHLAAIERDYQLDSMAWVISLQIVMLAIQLAILPVLLIEWCRRFLVLPVEREAQSRNEAGMTAVALAVAGSVACISGLLGGVADQWAVLVGCVASTGSAAGILAMHALSDAVPARLPVENVPGASDANLFFRDAMITLIIGVSGFSMLERDGFYFTTLTYTGASLASFGVLHWLAARVRKRPGSIALLEGCVIGSFMLATWMTVHFYERGMHVDVSTGLPEVVIGFGLGYFWTRVMLLGDGSIYPKGFPDIPRRGIGLDATGKFVGFLHVFLLGVSVAFTISATDPVTITYVYPVALAIAGVAIFMWAMSALRYKP